MNVLEYGREERRPGVWPWFVAYAILMAVVYLVVFGLGVVHLLFPDEVSADRIEAYIQGVLLVVLGLPLAAGYAAAPFLPRRPWVWIYDLVLICIGLTSVCCLPVTLPLLIFWIKPDTKSWFGRI